MTFHFSLQVAPNQSQSETLVLILGTQAKIVDSSTDACSPYARTASLLPPQGKTTMSAMKSQNQIATWLMSKY